jgi:hypothetical protein
MTTVYCGLRQKSTATKERDPSGEPVYSIQTPSSAPAARRPEFPRPSGTRSPRPSGPAPGFSPTIPAGTGRFPTIRASTGNARDHPGLLAGPPSRRPPLPGGFGSVRVFRNEVPAGRRRACGPEGEGAFPHRSGPSPRDAEGAGTPELLL